MRNVKLKAALFAATAALALQAGGAMAQAEKDYSGGHKPVLPDFTDELGVRVGSFILRPEASVSLEWSDNVFFSQNNEQEDFILRVSPQLVLESEWNRHKARFSTGASFGHFFQNEGDSFVDAWGEAQGIYDISRIAAIRATVRADQLHDRRGDIDVANASLEPVEYAIYSARVDGRYKPNRIRLSPFVEYSFHNYEDNSTITGESNNDDRDRSRVGGGLEVGYEFLRGYEAFARAQIDRVAYVDSVDDNGLERDSVGVKGLAGVRIDLTRLITADLGLGFVRRDYEDSSLNTLSGVTAEATATWSLTPLTTLVFTAERDIEETTQGAASGVFTTVGEIEVVHSLRRDLLISAFTNAVDRDFEGGGRQETSLGAGLGAEWVLNRNMSLEGRYEFSRRDSTLSGRDYTANQVTIGLTTKY